MQGPPGDVERLQVHGGGTAGPKTRDDGQGGQVVVTDRQGVTQFVVSLFVEAAGGGGVRAPKGEEIKVTLETDPGAGFEEDARVELINPRINAYQIDSSDGRSISGISFKATGLTPVGARPPVSPSPRSDDK